MTAEIHRDDLASKTGMWLFLFTEMLLFGGLFVVYTVYRYRNPQAFHLAAEELSVFIGTINTIILLVSSTTIAMSITAIQKKNKKLALMLIGITILLGLAFLANKYFEWGSHIREHIYPGSPVLTLRGHGDVLFYGLYFFMTGLHALHIIIGLVFIGFIASKIMRNKIDSGNYVLLENSGLYWHLVDLIWIFLFPLFYLIT
ncbi:MAG TPA: cytochrome C oxidase subunit III [Bacteroidales bacterium]|nr:cytochrome C oxidase subunit III [Bacteroidales bacterium]HBZ21099.1 cytochrome C oxidase subunit III [Bacteroidales bacterium]